MAMAATRRRLSKGLTLTELMAVMAVTSIIVLIISTLLVASQRQWSKTYAYANNSIESDAFLTMVKYGIMGRKSNKNDYVVYKVVNGAYVKALPPQGSPTSIVAGDAVEFRYWDGDFSGDLLDPAKTATAYAFYYLDGAQLKLDTGPYSSTTHIGAVQDGQKVTGSQVTTQVLSKRVKSITFSHTSKNAAGDGDGAVRMEVTFSDPANKDTLTVKAATLMRNVWPS
jgi:prepilin-type N-terminal cleavage/methylation domain-containing protein